MHENWSVLLMKPYKGKYIYKCTMYEDVHSWWEIYFALLKKHYLDTFFIWIFVWYTGFYIENPA